MGEPCRRHCVGTRFPQTPGDLVAIAGSPGGPETAATVRGVHTGDAGCSFYQLATPDGDCRYLCIAGDPAASWGGTVSGPVRPVEARWWAAPAQEHDTFFHRPRRAPDGDVWIWPGHVGPATHRRVAPAAEGI